MVKGGPIPCGFESWGKRQEEETAFNIMAWQAASAFSSCRSSSASNLSFKIKAVCSDITPASSCTKRSSCGGAWAADALMLVDEGGLEVVCVCFLCCCCCCFLVRLLRGNFQDCGQSIEKGTLCIWENFLRSIESSIASTHFTKVVYV